MAEIVEQLRSLFEDNRFRVVAAGVCGAVGAYCVYRSASRESGTIWQAIDDWRHPWQKVGTLSDVIIYPIKSAQSLHVPDARCHRYGVSHRGISDRVFIVYDPADGVGKPLSDHTYPSMHQLSAEGSSGDALHITHAASGTSIQLLTSGVLHRADKVKLRLYGHDCEAYDCGQPVADWLSQAIQHDRQQLRLALFRPQLANSRTFLNNGIYSQKMIANVVTLNDKPTFTNCTPLMLANDISLRDLNDRLPESDQVTMDSFRPNLVVSTQEPYEEDAWTQVKIGSARLIKIKICNRCKTTTIHPKEGVYSKTQEPMKTLMTYRPVPDELKKACGTAPVFGLNLGVLVEGDVTVGDCVWAKLKN